MAGLEFHLNGGTGQQRQWFLDAVGICRFPFNRMPNHTTEVHWVAEPPLPGHSEFAATLWTWTGAGDDRVVSASDIYIRDNLDDPDRDPEKRFDGKLFYMETVAHEIGHVIHAHFTPAQLAVVATDVFNGDVLHWNDPDLPWEERLQEAYAESVKDGYMPHSHRDYDNRTNHRITRGRWAAFNETMELLVCVAHGSTGGDGTIG